MVYRSDEKLQLFRKIIVDLTNQTLKPAEKIRKQPARGVDKLIGQTFTDGGEMFEITGTSQPSKRSKSHRLYKRERKEILLKHRRGQRMVRTTR
jgi:hypothetical protein